MTELSSPEDTLLTRIQVSHNCSLSLRGALVFFGATAAGSLTVAGYFTLQGLWPILPFAGLELLVLGVALGLSMRRGSFVEEISIHSDRVTVHRYGHGKQELAEFPRHWARVELRRSPRLGHPSRLLIRSHGRRFEVGASLTEDDRSRLERRLQELIGGVGQVPGISPEEQIRNT
ncbi:MAG: DUF2244 domain-containing protein [Chromatiales bacterium]|jgi:uncharacterized membrane protein|nr:DUF2244 domain-containing protein [Chromatiales bacterium]